MIFDETTREGIEPSDHLIGKFDYLNASARIEAQRIRDLLEDWIVRYPAKYRQDLIGRLRSRDDISHTSAFFELLLHELMLREGYSIIEIEPTLPNGRSPDFLVQAPDRSRFYLEATLATGMAHSEIGADRRMRDALQAIDDVVSPDFFLNLSTRGLPERPIAIRRLRRRVQEYVDDLDYDAAVRAFQRNDLYNPILRHEEHGARFRITAVPKNTRTQGDRAIGGRVLPGGVAQPNLHIKSSVESKAGRYGELDIPLIVAVNALSEYVNYHDAVNAVFGSEAVAVPENGPIRWIRNRDGAWIGPRGPVHTRCSGLLFFRRLSPWSIAMRTPRLILNPWAQNPLVNLPPNIQVGTVENERLNWQQGQSLQQIFDLDHGWPE